jgi:hypothetical protein
MVLLSNVDELGLRETDGFDFGQGRIAEIVQFSRTAIWAKTARTIKPITAASFRWIVCISEYRAHFVTHQGNVAATRASDEYERPFAAAKTGTFLLIQGPPPMWWNDSHPILAATCH